MRLRRSSHWSFGLDGAVNPAGGCTGRPIRIFHLVYRLLSILACLLLLAIAEPSLAATSGMRLALVIGNSNYKNAVDLPNAAGDAQAIAGKLKELGFEVDTGVDVNLDTFENMLYEFRDKIRATGAEDVVFYYAGHGFQLDGRNHLVPTDAKLSAREKIGYETVQLNGLIKRININPQKQRTIVFLDACRDNPLPESVRGEDFENGLADVQMGKDGDNVMVIFSTKPGDVSQDGKDGNSPFAQSLLRHIATPNETVTDMMTEVSNEVSEATNNLQSPRFSGILRSKFYFNLKSTIVAASEPTDEPAAPQLPKETKIAGLEPGEAIDPAPDRGIAVIRPSPAKPASGVPVAGKPTSPSVTLSQDDTEPASPVPETPQSSTGIADNSPNLAAAPSASIALKPVSEVLSSRIFAGPTQYPPKHFAAYGILAFRARASSQDRARHLLACDAYMAVLPHTSELAIPGESQMVTVWPINTDDDAEELNHRPLDEKPCEAAVNKYGLVVALQALIEAERAGAQLSGNGPFLLAWSPSSDKGNADALVLVANLSHVTAYSQALEIFTKWSRDIEHNPKLWKSKGWDVEQVRRIIQLWVDENGTKIMELIGSKD